MIDCFNLTIPPTPLPNEVRSRDCGNSMSRLPFRIRPPFVRVLIKVPTLARTPQDYTNITTCEEVVIFGYNPLTDYDTNSLAK